MNREQLVAELFKAPVEVIFTKKNGDLRTMICTLNEAFLPEQNPPTTEKPRRPVTDLVTVWDLESEGWRSFNFDQVLEVEYDNDEGTCMRWKRL